MSEHSTLTPPPPNRPVLFIRFSSMGDVILTLPIIQQYARSNPGTPIHVLTKKSFAAIVRNEPAVTKTWTLEKGSLRDLFQLLSSIAALKPQLVIDLHGSLRSRIVRAYFLLRGTPARRFRRPYFRRTLLTALKINLYKEFHVLDGYAQTAGVSTPQKWRYPITPRGQAEADALSRKLFGPDQPPAGYICIMPFSRWFTKEWPVEHYGQLIDLLQNRYPGTYILLLGGEGEALAADKLAPGSALVHNLAGRLDLDPTAALIAQARLFIGGDTGLLHMATGLQVPIIAIMGSSVREFGFYPRADQTTILENDLDCRPCASKGRDSCPQEHFKCMRDTTPQMVFQAVRNVLQ